MLIFVISWLVLIANIFTLVAAVEYELVLKITPPSPFEHPYGLGISPEQKLYVTDSGNNRVCVFSTSGEFLFAFGQGELSEPSDVAFDREGNVYVSSCDEGRVKKFTAGGVYLEQSLESLKQPEGVCIDSQGNIYVVSKGSNQIKKFNSQHELVGEWGAPGDGPGEFNTPYGIAVDAYDYIYVADWNNNRIQKFDSEGNYVTEWKGNPYPFDRVEDIAFDSEGNFYVTEVGAERIQKFTPNGEFITKWGLDEFRNLGCVALDQEDNVYVTCYYGDCVYKFALKSPIEHRERVEVEFGLSAPNPWNSKGWLRFEMLREGKVVMRIYNVLGQLVREMDFGVKGAGRYQGGWRAIYWDGRNRNSQSVPGGIYFWQLVGEGRVITKQIVILK